MSLDVPKTRCHVRQFVGLINFIRRHIPRLSQQLVLFTDLQSEKKKFEWTKSHQKAFEEVKRSVAESTLLRHSNFAEVFEVFYDASKDAFGGIVMQSHGPILFFSRKLSVAQKNYSVMEQELLAIITILDKNRTLL